MLTSEKVRALHNKVSMDGAKLLQHTEGGTVFAIDPIADEVVQLEARLLAHEENEGDECPLCKLEAELAQLKEDCAPFQAQIDQRKTYEIPELPPSDDGELLEKE